MVFGSAFTRDKFAERINPCIAMLMESGKPIFGVLSHSFIQQA